MTSIARDALKPVKTGAAAIDKRLSRAARNTDRALTRIEDRADDMLDSGRSIAKSIHERIEQRPHASFLAALALGAAVGLLSRARR